MTALVRSAALTHFTDLAAACGLDAAALVTGVGLPPRCLVDPDLKVPAHLVGRLLETAAARGREPVFGLRLAESRRLSNLGPLALLVRDEPTLRLALETLMHHIHVHNEAVAVQVDEHGGLVVIRTELSADGAGSLRQATELVVGVTCRVLQVLLGANWRPRLVCFTHTAPPSLAVHHRVLGPAVEFGHEFNGIVCNAADLDAPNPGADPVLARYSQTPVGTDAGARLAHGRPRAPAGRAAAAARVVPGGGGGTAPGHRPAHRAPPARGRVVELQRHCRSGAARAGAALCRRHGPTVDSRSPRSWASLRRARSRAGTVVASAAAPRATAQPRADRSGVVATRRFSSRA